MSDTLAIFTVKVDDLTSIEIMENIRQAIISSKKIMVSNVNIHALNLAYTLPWFRAFLNRSEIVFCDGFGVILGARLLGIRLRHRNTPPDWLGALSRLCAQQGYTLYFLGGQPGVAARAAQKLTASAPGLQVLGCQHGYFDKSPTSPENESVLAEINRLRPDLLLVGFGMPAQERWLQENWQRLPVHAALPVGAAFDYVAGEVRRAPRWMTDHGLEWLGRLLIEPRRLWQRYLIGNPLFFWRVLKQRLGLLRLPE